MARQRASGRGVVGMLPSTLSAQLAAREAELGEVRWMLDQTQRIARLGSWERDIKTGETVWSDELFRIHGLEPRSVRESRELAEEFTHPADVRLRAEWVQEMAANPGLEIEQTWRIVRRTGEIRTVRARGKIVQGGHGGGERLVGTVQDVTEEHRNMRAHMLLAQVVQSSTEAIFTIGPDERIRSWNPAAEDLYGYTREEITDLHVNVLLPPDSQSEAELEARSKRRQEVLSGVYETIEYEEPRLTKSGRLVDVQGRLTALRDHEGTIIGLVANHLDITDRRRAESQLAHLAAHDALTGLVNRHRFEEELAATSARAEREGCEAAVITLDIDDFSDMNQTYGHNRGDELIAMVAEALRSAVPSGDMLARIGVDEFAVVTAPSTVEKATAVAKTLVEAVHGCRLDCGHFVLMVTLSVGVVGFGGQNAGVPVTPEELLEEVEQAMYESKSAGRNEITVYTSADRVNSSMKRRSAGEHLIREALKNDLFELYAQPIVRLSTGLISHAEILLRMNTDDGVRSPAAFLPAAERHGLMSLVDYWVIAHAFEVAARNRDLSFAINLSGATVDDPRLPSFIGHELRNSGVNPDRVVFELTETAAVGNIARARELARRLADLGCRFAIDDFGAGFSTFYYLKHIPADYLKIDGEFVKDPRSQMNQLVIQSIVGLALKLGKETIAEYVSDAQTYAQVRNLGVDYGQGYHFAKPFPVAELSTLARQLIPGCANPSDAPPRGRPNGRVLKLKPRPYAPRAAGTQLASQDNAAI